MILGCQCIVKIVKVKSRMRLSEFNLNLYQVQVHLTNFLLDLMFHCLPLTGHTRDLIAWWVKQHLHLNITNHQARIWKTLLLIFVCTCWNFLRSFRIIHFIAALFTLFNFTSLHLEPNARKIVGTNDKTFRKTCKTSCEKS